MEVWDETVERVVDGNLNLVDKKFWKRNERAELIDLIRNFKALPAGRHLWVSGVEGRQFLFNCFSGETPIHTLEGIKPIGSLAGRKLKILSLNGVYRNAEIKSFGKQGLFEVMFSDGTSVFATKNHRWIVNKRTNPVTTDKLIGHDVPFETRAKGGMIGSSSYTQGIMHGFVFGDGSRQKKAANLLAFGAAAENIGEVFESQGYKVTSPEYCDRYIGRLPLSWKSLPTKEQIEDRSYLYGFIAGFIAADGHVDKRGSVTLYQSDKDVLEFIKTNAPLAGLLTSQKIKLHRKTSPFDGSNKPLYALTFRRFSIDPEILINPIHIENWKKAPKINSRALRVVDVKETSRYETVYCAVEPKTETMVVGQGLLTKNCHVAGWREKLSDHYSFVFDELMKGGGVGANYSNRFIRRYPAIKNSLEVHFVCDPQHKDYESRDGRAANKDMCSDEYHHQWAGCIAVDDSRQGWVDCLVKIIDAVHGKKNGVLVFDVSRIRAYGEPIKGFGGTASGPGALMRMALGIVELLNERVGKKLTSIDHMLMDHMIAKCVQAGNVRRSARMSIKHWKDEDIFEFIKCKTDEARVAHWTTNISVEIDNAFFRAFKKGDKHAKKVYKACVDGMYASSEPGFWNHSLSQHGETQEVVSTNPCGEICLIPFGNCNLGHINLAAFYNDQEGAMRAFKLMTRFLIRATFGDIGSPWQQEVVKRNRRIGVGFFGFQDWLCLQGIKYSECHEHPKIRATLRKFYNVVKEESVAYAHHLRIVAPIKVTTIAPTGTTAKLAGTSEGCQAIMAPYFELRVRHQIGSDVLMRAAAEGHEIEDCVNEEEAVNTQIVKYVCKHPLVEQVDKAGLDSTELVEGQGDISLYDTLAIQSMLQSSWADNSISLTVNLTPATTKKELYHTLIKFLPRLKGTTVSIGAGNRPQPPYTVITKEEYEAYHGKKVQRQGIGDCVGNSCPIK
jgi:adenosylcobalamin-dependent ribonucleoside-triphosphate reductase